MFLANAWDIESNWFTDWFYSPNFIEIGSFSIAKYAVCILTGIILAYLVCTKEGKRLGIDKDIVLSELAWIAPVCILGARIWYMIGDGVPTFKNYLDAGNNFFLSVIKIIGYTFGIDNGRFNGISGLAIHGGVACAIPLAFWRSRAHGYKFSVIFDMLAPGLLIGQICGRWGNFFNREAYGIVVGGWEYIKETGMLIPNLSIEEQYKVLTENFLIPKFIANNMYIYSGSQGYYYGIVDGIQTYGSVNGYNFFHPTFLYESLLNLLGLITYFILRRNKHIHSGFFIGFYLIWYGVVRFFVESIRCDSLYLGSITFLKMAQLTSILMILGGIALILFFRYNKNNVKYKDLLEENKGTK